MRILLQEFYIHHHFFPTDSHSFLLDIQLLRQSLRITGQSSTATDHKHGADRFITIKFPNLICHLSGHILDHRRGYFLYLFCRDCLGQPHNIPVFNLFFHTGFSFNMLCRSKIHQTVLGNDLGQTVSCNGNHAIGYNTAILGNGNIRGAGSDIYQSYIQHTIHLRNGNPDRGNRLQSQIHDLQPGYTDCLIQTIYHILR